MAGAGYPTGYAAAAPQAGYDAGSDYAGNGYTAKRAVQNVAQESSSINQVQSACKCKQTVIAAVNYCDIGILKIISKHKFINTTGGGIILYL